RRNTGDRLDARRLRGTPAVHRVAPGAGRTGDSVRLPQLRVSGARELDRGARCGASDAMRGPTGREVPWPSWDRRATIDRMRLELEVWLRGNDFATTDVVDVPVADGAAWTDTDVSLVLKELLRSIDRAKHPEADRNRPVALRGFSWIVSPFEGGGHTIAVEIQ